MSHFFERSQCLTPSAPEGILRYVKQRLLGSVAVIASACTALHFSTTEQQSVTVANSPYTFNGPGSQTFVISPAGSSDHDVLLAINKNTCSSQWTIDTSIDPQQPVEGAHVCGVSAAFAGSNVTCPRNYQLGARYAGTLPGTSFCNVRIDTMVYGGSTYGGFTLVLTGVGSASSGITVSPVQVAFPAVQIATQSSPSQVEVRNVGSASVTVNGSLSNGSAFQVTPSVSSFALGPGAKMIFDVTCTPTVVGPYSGTLSFSAGSSSGSASLACNGIDSTVVVAPTQVDFGRTLIGRAPPPRSVRISGNGAAIIETVTLDAAAIAAGVAIETNPVGMAVGSGQDVVLSYAAAATHEAGPLGVLSVKFDVDPDARPIGLSGQAMLGGVGTNPASIEFGAVCAGAMVTKDVEVYASEPGDVVVQGLTKPDAPFDATAQESLPKSLAGNHTGPSLMVRARLQPPEPGEHTSMFAITSDVPGASTTEVELRGVALAPGVAATPNTVHFGTAAAGTTTSIKEVQLTNCGTSDLAFSRAFITGDDALEFTLIGVSPARTLKPTESEVFMVVMQPERSGFKTASLVLEHELGTTTALLDGTGEGGKSSERETYYACSTGRAAGWWPMALALLALRRRSRR